MKIIAIVAFLTTLLATPAFGKDITPEVTRQVRSTGCRAAVVTSDEVSILKSFYNDRNKTLYIGTLQDKMPQAYHDAIIFHEAGHCNQDQEGMMKEYDVIRNAAEKSAEENGGYPDEAIMAQLSAKSLAIELDADTRSAETMCRLGLDGRSIYYELLMYVKTHYGYTGDEFHGSLQDRINAASGSSMCKLMDRPTGS